jgi:RNA polymerase sigma-70 factor (ECF subfamily)
VRHEQAVRVAEFYAIVCPRLIGYLTVLTGSRADVEEIAQDTFVQALRHWSRIGQYDDPTAWLYQVATRLAISRGQVARRGLRRLSAGLEDSVDVSPDGRIDVDAALTRLPVDHRAVLLLHYVHDLSIGEVARMLDRLTHLHTSSPPVSAPQLRPRCLPSTRSAVAPAAPVCGTPWSSRRARRVSRAWR